MPYQREAEAVLALWREVERDLATAASGSPEAEGLIAEAARLRDEYQRHVQQAIEHDQLVPPALPEPTEAS